MTEPLFDLAAHYDAMLERGLRLTGESKEYFARGRVTFLQRHVPVNGPLRVLDFGCGLGGTTRLLRSVLRGSVVFGCDTSEKAVRLAAERNSSEGVSFGSIADVDRWAPFDLVYTNGVFHHIEPGEKRLRAATAIREWLNPGGLFALFENNPFNPGTRLVMKRIPFDRDARLITPRAAAALLTKAGFVQASTAHYLFVFPAFLHVFRSLERYLVRAPLGGQYCLLGRRQS